MSYYCLHHIKRPSTRDCSSLIVDTRAAAVEQLASQGISTIGIFRGLFGLASNEIYLLTYSQADQYKSDFLVNNSVTLKRLQLLPSIRPVQHAPLVTPGIYVFRFWQLDAQHIPDLIRLSENAWRTFEQGFESEVFGLFTEDTCHASRQGLLLTWYRDLSVWQSSRTPDANARENFRQRQLLIDEALPIATSLAEL